MPIVDCLSRRGRKNTPDNGREYIGGWQCGRRDDVGIQIPESVERRAQKIDAHALAHGGYVLLRDRYNDYRIAAAGQGGPELKTIPVVLSMEPIASPNLEDRPRPGVLRRIRV